jgi:acyl carrier protein
MLPAAYVVLDQLPLTANGKVDRQRLPLPELSTGLHVEPSTQTERRLLAIWQDVLNQPQISTTSQFFELGGHSLLATRVVGLIVREFGCPLKLKDLFAHPTISELATWIDALDTQSAVLAAPNDEALEEVEW